MLMATSAVTRGSKEDWLADQTEQLLDPLHGFRKALEREQDTPDQKDDQEAQSPTAFEQQELGEKHTVATSPQPGSHLTQPPRRASTYSDPGYVYYNYPTTFEPDHASGVQQLSSSYSETCLFVQGDKEFTCQDPPEIDGEDSTDSSHHDQPSRPKNKPSLHHRVTKPLTAFVSHFSRVLTQPRSPPQLVAFQSGRNSEGTIINILATLPGSSGLVLYWSREQSQLLIGAATQCDPDALFTVLLDSATGEYQFSRPDGYLGIDDDLTFRLFSQSCPTNGTTKFHFSGNPSLPGNKISFTLTSQEYVWAATMDDSHSNTGHVEIKDATAKDNVSVFSISPPVCPSV